MKRLLFSIVLFCGSAALLCAGNAQKPTTSKYFRSMGGGFGCDGEKHEMFYGVDLEVRNSIPDDAVADILFENPADKKAPLLTTIVLKGHPKSISAKSPALPSVENNHIYSYTVILYRDGSRKEKLGEHSQKLGFSVPDELFETVFKPSYFKKK